MSDRAEKNAIKNLGKEMISLLGLTGSPVGVEFISPGEPYPAGAEKLYRCRYCQALMKARHGHSVILDAEGISCPAAAAAFGFRPLPRALAAGTGLIGFGIVSDEKIGEKIFKNMPKLERGAVKGLHLYPLDEAESLPDVVVVEEEVEKLMWIVLSYLHVTGGERVAGSTAVLQAACVDATVIPYLEERLNFGYGCYGCRDATDIGANETILGFPGSKLAAIVLHLTYLGTEAICTSRSKRAWRSLQRDISEKSAGCAEARGSSMPSYLIAISRNAAVWLAEKGFSTNEGPFFLYDVFSLLEKFGCESVDKINRGLEQFGWGSRILDQGSFDKILHLYRSYRSLSEREQRHPMRVSAIFHDRCSA